MNSEITPPKKLTLDDGRVLQKTFIEERLKEHIKSSDTDPEEDEERSFFIADMGEVHRQFLRWQRNLERVKPFYGMFGE